MKTINSSLVYCIFNIQTQMRYVGSTSKNLPTRKRQHLYELRKKIHPSKLMQKDYNIYGEDSLIFIKLEDVFTFEQDELFKKEQEWIDKYKPEYNVNELAGNHVPKSRYSEDAKRRQSEKMKGRRASAETKKKMSEAQLKRYKDPVEREKQKWTPEQHEHFKRIMSGKGNPNWGTKRTQEFKDMIGNLFSSMQFRYISPAGEEVIFRNLSKFCRDNNLPYHIMRSLHQGKRKTPYKGWVFKDKVFVGYNK